MEIIHISAECYPVAKAGGLGDVVGALPKYQTKAGHFAKVVMPMYRTKFLNENEFVVDFKGHTNLGDRWFDYTIIKEKTNKLGFDLYLVDIHGLLDRENIYSYDDDTERFTAFQIAVVHWLSHWEHKPDVVHCHDHHTGLIPFMMQYCFDYKKEDCYQFHEAVKLHVMPLVDKIYQHKRQKLNVETLRPWDLEAEPAGVKPLNPFLTGGELLYKTEKCFSEMNPFFADCLRKMNSLKHLDLESRKGKAPGGYNCPLAESGAPFIFMNAAGQMSDVTTMVHEGGHAIHSFLSHHLELNAFKEYPMEIAEVASMAMELFSMYHWKAFFDSEEELNRAKEHQLERVITIFPWIAIIDKFQHWIYKHPQHTMEERTENWLKILDEYSSKIIDYSGLEEYRKIGWQRQLHLFEVPFYYIEYGIAQLGAIGLWMQYQQNPAQALQNYINALSLGGTKTLPELYAAAGLKFDFSPGYIKTLMQFVDDEMKKLY